MGLEDILLRELVAPHWISYMTAVQLFGVSPSDMHAVNVALHALTALLLFLALVRMTRQPWRCALVASVVRFAAAACPIRGVDF